MLELQVKAGLEAPTRTLLGSMQALDPAALREDAGQLQERPLVSAEVPADAGGIAVDAATALAARASSRHALRRAQAPQFRRSLSRMDRPR